MLESNKCLRVYSGMIQLAKILHTVNYSIGRQFFFFKETIGAAGDQVFKQMLSFHQKTLNVVFKDYNVTNRENKWVIIEGQHLLESIINEIVS